MNLRETRMLAFANQVSVSAAFIVYVSVAIWLKIFCRNLSVLGRTAMAGVKSLDDADWIDGEIAAAPYTTSGHQIVWQVYIGHVHDAMNWVDFKPHESLRMEAALANKEDSVSLKLYDDTWSIDLASMQQTNDQTQKKRPIRRIVIVKQADFKY